MLLEFFVGPHFKIKGIPECSMFWVCQYIVTEPKIKLANMQKGLSVPLFVIYVLVIKYIFLDAIKVRLLNAGCFIWKGHLVTRKRFDKNMY